jgi:hypothetical protein
VARLQLLPAAGHCTAARRIRVTRQRRATLDQWVAGHQRLDAAAIRRVHPNAPVTSKTLADSSFEITPKMR